MALSRRLVALDLRYRWWFSALLVVLTLAQYGASVGFGLMWDDPRIYQATAAVSPWWKAFLIPSPPTEQYYRPLAVLYSQLMVTPPGRVNAPLAHTLHLGVHLTILLALVPFLCGLRFNRAHARLTALCFALFPPAYFDIAWHQTQQPLMMAGVILAAIAARKFIRRRRPGDLALSLLAYALGLFVFEGGVAFVFVFFWLAWSDCRSSLRSLLGRPGWRGLAAAGWPGLYLAVTALYLLVWLSLPLHRSVTGTGFQLSVLAYLTQGTVFPLAQIGAGTLANWPIDRQLILFVAVWSLLTLGVWIWHSGRAALLSNLWVGAGLAPLWAGLAWEYARDGARLLYPAALGIAMVWGGWMALAFRPRFWQRALGMVVLAGVVVSSLWQFARLQQLFQTSTGHMARAVQVLSAAPQARLLFVNFPDQINLRVPVYPMGNWGVIQAPVVQNLADYALALSGHSAADSSLSSSSVGAAERAAWPYRVDMRGIDTPPAAFFEAARPADAVYLTNYLPGGKLGLAEVGGIRPSSQDESYLAGFGDATQLVKAEISLGGELRLVWRCLKPLEPDDTIFVHLWRGDELAGNADGDSLGGLVPPSTWQAGADILDIRTITDKVPGPGTYQVRVGLYNRVTGARYPAVAADGKAQPDNEMPIGSFAR